MFFSCSSGCRFLSFEKKKKGGVMYSVSGCIGLATLIPNVVVTIGWLCIAFNACSFSFDFILECYN